MITAGKHRAKAVEWTQVRPHEKTGNEEIQISFQITDQDGPDKGGTITYYGYFTEATAERTIESLRYCGWEGDDITDIQGLDKNEVQIVVEHEPKQDGSGIRARVAWVNRLGGVYVGQPMADAQKAAFKKRMAALVIASKGPRKPKTDSGTDFPHGANAGAGGAPPAQQEKRAGGIKL